MLRPTTLLSLLGLALAAPALAQTGPTITQADFPVAGDTLRLSQATAVPAGAPPLTQTGPNQTWNYGGLTATTQRVASYKAVADVATGFQLIIFGPFGGNNRASLAATTQLPAPPAGVSLPITDPLEFFRLSATDFRSVGYGGTLAGTAVPVVYASDANNQPQQDIIYRLPLAYGNAPDASDSYFTVSAAGMGGLSQKRHRTNTIDGWGSLTTPFGTYQAVRVLTTLDDLDTVQIGTAPSQGFEIHHREYKWLANGQHEPLLTVTTRVLATGGEQLLGAEYRDIYRRIVSPLAAHAATLPGEVSAYPSPAPAGTGLRVRVPATAGPLTLTGRDVLGRQLFSRAVPAGTTEVLLDAATLGSYHGVLLLTLRGEQGTATRRVVRE